MFRHVHPTALSLLVFLAGCSGGAAPAQDSPALGGGGTGGNTGGAATDAGIGGSPSDDAGSGVTGEDSGTAPSRDAGLIIDGGAAHDDANVEVEDGGLNPSVAPGGNFDLSIWELQEPIGSPGSPTTISASQLDGPTGFQSAYFFTDPDDGSMSFWDPENGVTTANSDYPRSELREMTAGGAAANWMSTGTNTLSATVKATQVPDHVCVGQIHLGTGTPASTKPLLELFYFSTGVITIGIEQTPAGGNEVQTNVGNVPLGTKWSYVIGLSGNTITLSINGGAVQTFAMSSTFNDEGMYFKAGDYDQSVGTGATVGAKVQFYSLSVFHGP